MNQYRTRTLVLIVILAIPSTRVESSPGFIRNDGQWPTEVSFLLRQGDADFWFTSEGVVVSEYHYGDIDRPRTLDIRSELDLEPVEPVERSVLRVRFLDASPDAVIAGESPLSEYHNYFLGDDPLQWRSHVPLYNGIRYRGIYPGIDVLYHIGVSGLKYDLTVAPGADPNRIIIEYRGADGLDVTSSGELRVETGETVLVEGRPEAWQIRDGCREPVDISYRLLGHSTVMFDIGNHDPSLPLVIDPPLELLYGSYLGGSNRDFGTALVLAADGSILLCGSTRSSDFPTQNPYQSSFAGYSDAFISKFSPDGSQLS